MLRPRLEVVVRPNQITVQDLDSGQVASAEGPFSCDHLLTDQVEILEHVLRRALKGVARSTWTFPRITIRTGGTPIHRIEEKVLRDAMLNSGASQVTFDPSLKRVDEHSAARLAYIDDAKRRR